MATDRFIVKSHRPLRRLAVLSVASLSFALTGWLAYLAGSRDASSELRVLRATAQEATQENHELIEVNVVLRERVAMLERSAQVNERALRAVRLTLAEQRERIAALGENVAFYQGILKPEDPSRQLSIHSLRLTPVGSAHDQYGFLLVLTQVLKSDMVLEGTVELSVEGESEDSSSQASRPARVVTLPFRFRHFQRLEGRLRLPPELRPSRVLVQAEAKGKERVIRVRRAFGWYEQLHIAGDDAS